MATRRAHSSAYEGDYKSILGGVSQQVYTERQINQVSVQDNMTSDSVRGLRKRPGTRLISKLTDPDGNYLTTGQYGVYRGYEANLGGGVLQFLVNTAKGSIMAVAQDGGVHYIAHTSYLQTGTPSDIVFTTVGSTMYIANCGVRPGFSNRSLPLDPARRGYYFVLSGAYGKEFAVTVTTALGTHTSSYTTPDGTATGDATKATPEYIATQLATDLIANMAALGLSNVDRVGGYIYLATDGTGGTINVRGTNSTTYAIGSNTHTVDLTSKLPATLPSSADGFIMTVGDASFAQYYRWDYSASRWIECATYTSNGPIVNMPVAINFSVSGGNYFMTTPTYPQRDAGDDDTNADPAFTDTDGYGITGLASFQGRLIIFSGPYICMGSNNKLDRTDFYRTTVTQVLDDDRIEITSTSFSGASFKYGIPFNTDLILASEAHQGVIPGRNAVLTPQTATAILTSTYQMGMGTAPMASGRSLYFTYPRSNSSFSVKEMMPSGYTDSQYVSQDTTDHLPTYLEGACAYMTSSTTNNIVVLGSTTEDQYLYVNEYLWSGDDKVLSSWHRWYLPFRVHMSWFVREELYMLIEHGSSLMIIKLSLRDSPDISDTARYLPAGDCLLAMGITGTATDNPYIQFDTSGITSYLWELITGHTTPYIGAAVADGAFLGAELGIRSIDNTNRRVYLEPTYGNATAYIGIRFRINFSPTPPRMLNANGDYVDLRKMVIMFYKMTIRYSTPFNITATDRGGSSLSGVDAYTIDYDSQELGLSTAPLAERFKMRIRVGMEVESSSFVVTSTTMGDLNIQDMGYIIKFNNKLTRV